MQTKQLICKRVTLHSCGPVEIGRVYVQTGGKPPKLRFKPGSLIEYSGTKYEIVFCYRLADDPHEWKYELEESKPLSKITDIAFALGCGKGTPRVVYDLFRNESDVFSFFGDIPRNADRIILTNKEMISQARVLKESHE